MSTRIRIAYSGLFGVVLYRSVVICSETSPIRKIINAVENNSALMFVNRFCAIYV